MIACMVFLLTLMSSVAFVIQRWCLGGCLAGMMEEGVDGICGYADEMEMRVETIALYVL